MRERDNKREKNIAVHLAKNIEHPSERAIARVFGKTELQETAVCGFLSLKSLMMLEPRCAGEIATVRK